MKIGPLLAHLGELETAYAGALRQAAQRHKGDHDVYHQCRTFALVADGTADTLAPLRQRYDGKAEWRIVIPSAGETLLEELRSLYLFAHEVAVTWNMAQQAAKAVRDPELEEFAGEFHSKTETQAKWFLTRIKVGAPQALVVA